MTSDETADQSGANEEESQRVFAMLNAHVMELMVERANVRGGQYGPAHDRNHDGLAHLRTEVRNRLAFATDGYAYRGTWVAVGQFALAALELIDNEPQADEVAPVVPQIRGH